MNSFTGTLAIFNGSSFLQQMTADGQLVQTIMMMRNIPLGGNDQQRIAAATSYFVNQCHLTQGSPLTVLADVVSYGTVYALDVTS